MGLLLLLTCTLLSSYFHPGRVVDAVSIFTITRVTLSIEPRANVTRDTNVTMRCKAIVITSQQEALSRQYTLYKDNIAIYTKTSSSLDDFLYQLPETRVSNTGKYQCKIIIEGKKSDSEIKKLTVTGLSTPELHLNKGVVSEGEELTARCTAPGETGSIIFYFYEDSKEILEEQVHSNQAEVKLGFNSVGYHKIHCAYTVLLKRDSVKSKESNNVNISVREFPIKPVLEIIPEYNIYEGDRLDISCTIIKSQHSSQSIHLYLSQGTVLLSSEITKAKVNHSILAQAKDSGEFECRLEIGNIVKVTKKTVSVNELFSVPTLTMMPAEVFQKESMTLTCKSESYASERLRREELTYTLDPPESLLTPKDTGVFFGTALPYDFNYTCIAQAKDIMKRSNTLTVHPKVSVSTPKISVVKRAILGRPFEILCKSDIGSLPINYTLIKDYDHLRTITIKLPDHRAVFTDTITYIDEISKYMCEAKNGHRDGLLSKRLNATVTVPLSNPTLIVIPPLEEISEGDHLYMICGVQGTPPVTFRWYRVGNEKPLITTTSDSNNTDYQVKKLAKDHSGTYYCEAINYALNVVQSRRVTIEVRLALWKKAVIGGSCLMVVLVLLVVCVLYFRSKRGKREAAAELSIESGQSCHQCVERATT